VDQSRTNLDLIRHLDIPVIVIIGLKLGCINDALLTQHALESNGIKTAGWVGNLIDPKMDEVDKNIEYLKQNIKSNCLGIARHKDSNFKLDI
jgi:dethiobiotin synthetase